jgi:hypothetical protein
MHVVYMYISVLMNHDCTTRPILPFITITIKLLSEHCIKKVLDTEMIGYHQCYRKTFLRSVDPKQPKNVKFSLWSIIETFPRGGAWLFRGGAKRPQGRCAPPLKVRPCAAQSHFRAAEVGAGSMTEGPYSYISRSCSWLGLNKCTKFKLEISIYKSLQHK